MIIKPILYSDLVITILFEKIQIINRMTCKQHLDNLDILACVGFSQEFQCPEPLSKKSV